MWSTLDIGITFAQPTSIRAQLDKLANGGRPKPPSRVDSGGNSVTAIGADPARRSSLARAPLSPYSALDANARFTALRSFYKEQIASASASETGLPTAGLDLYSSPSSLARIMNLYSSVGLGNPTARSVSELRPIPALLRTKRSKRCAACSHILVRPEFKPTSTRYRIRLLALNYIPFVTLRPMPGQWILTMRNPLYEKVNVTLGAEAMTPGRHRHRVTILCPEFEVGKSGDVRAASKKSTATSKASSRLLDEGEGDEEEDEAAMRDDGRREVAYWMVLGVGRVKT
ncbi:hypothetical protein DV738_g2469, partial [Chaetothyriales sp. CBS 135597]